MNSWNDQKYFEVATGQKTVTKMIIIKFKQIFYNQPVLPADTTSLRMMSGSNNTGLHSCSVSVPIRGCLGGRPGPRRRFRPELEGLCGRVVSI